MKNAPTAVSLFAGAGGCSLGFQQAGYKIMYANELNENAAETYKANFPSTVVEKKDIRQVDLERLDERLQTLGDDLDIVIGGPPCQGFSTAGVRFWDDPRNHLLKQYVRVLKTLRPKWFLMENVEGLLTSNNGQYVFEAAKAFIELGYKIRIEKVYAQEFGVPQRRKRVIILGNRLGKDFRFPEPVSVSHGKIFRKSEVTLAHALEGLPPVANSPIALAYPQNVRPFSWSDFLKGKKNLVSDHFCPPLDPLQLERIENLQPGQTMKDLPENLQHPSFQKRANRRVSDGMPSEKRGGAPSGLKRLRLDEPCLTITGAATREFVHPTENRCLSIRECARIQTFPDDFEFKGSSSDKIQQIGNAIPPLLAKHFALHIASIGFVAEHSGPNVEPNHGELLGFLLSKSDGQSPQLRQTEHLLHKLSNTGKFQLQLF